ncbi:MAG: hypothetical protein N2491_01735 [Negativicutes bacterium]|nr:hypothetical protein [Negativicutes bacterium]
MTLQEQMDQINLAIQKIENGAQEYRIGNRLIRRGDLATLYRERRQLQQEIAAAENSDGIYTVAYYR